MLVAVSGSGFECVELILNWLMKQHDFEVIDNSKKDDDILDYATKNYTSNMVVHCEKLSLLDLLSKRPFFVHMSVEGTTALKLKFNNFYNKENKSDTMSMQEALDAISNINETKHSILLSENAHFKFKLVTDDDVDTLNEKLRKAISQILNEIELKNSASELSPPLRPNWDEYFMKLATLAASRANCMKRRVGCVIVRDRRVIATGYNGTPRHLTNCFNGGCPRCNDGNSGNLHTCLCLHAEENALLEAGRDRIGSNATLYCDTCPCLTCSVKIVQTGITEVVYSQSYNMDEDSFRVLKSGGVKIRKFNLIQEPRIIFI
ncbi:hypothetical protein TPHA_0F02270 [Tetrapisispora phaffii CBS 4417]|uniref:Deoxycytidylate deaminase n=1 Tax=Tetrapisispora phaffii (strain ATCC 24235 / CBS 4417 / NBRC 1672 / NRRL Y-8282 / UCD 70-5) TaxID=1071381 RepID=G8BUC2_TETPH|nr:hypothetical protein TPHA_0F02270 [Tetrapisispora phaffii CBS 4417]CCE63708.1 hypothetical protein TPHA_0F02270 [Tetrapisispora phaffii CBS 4417]